MATADRAARDDVKVPLDMTPMIDIVFQLMIFFLLTLRISTAEGDFQVRMPAHGSGQQTSSAFLPPLKLRMVSADDGELAAIQLNGRPIANFSQLRKEVSQLVHNAGETPAASDLEVEIDSDPPLHYGHVIAAITAVSGERTKDGVLVPLVNRIKFAPPR